MPGSIRLNDDPGPGCLHRRRLSRHAGGLERALDLNRRFRPQLDALVAALLEHETLDAKEVTAVFGPAAPADIEAGIVPQQPATIEAAGTAAVVQTD